MVTDMYRCMIISSGGVLIMVQPWYRQPVAREENRDSSSIDPSIYFHVSMFRMTYMLDSPQHISTTIQNNQNNQQSKPNNILGSALSGSLYDTHLGNYRDNQSSHHTIMPSWISNQTDDYSGSGEDKEASTESPMEEEVINESNEILGYILCSLAGVFASVR